MECPTCEGAGHCPTCESAGACKNCEGEGCEQCSDTGECPTCGGWGDCHQCEGTGKADEPSTDVALLENSPVETAGVLSDGSEWSIEVVETGVNFHGDVPVENWTSFTGSLVVFDNWTKWALADALNFAETKYGDKYSQAVEDTGLSYSTLTQLTWIGREVPREMRVPGLKMEYHKKVAPKRIAPEAKKEYLKRAAAGEFESSSQMAEVIDQELFPDRVPVIETCGCPICGANGEEGFTLKVLHKAECSKCGAHGEELADRAVGLAALKEAFDELAAENAALRELLDARPKAEGGV